MVRVIYVRTQVSSRKDLLIEASVKGEKWSKENSRAKVTDKEMVDLAQELQGWTQSVYKFGCAFIHLSDLHDYNDRDPLAQLPEDERNDILRHCRYYHGGPAEGRESFNDLIPFFPNVLDKISGNLECYLDDLERGEVCHASEV